MVFTTLIHAMNKHGLNRITACDLKTLADMTMENERSKEVGISKMDRKIIQAILIELSKSIDDHSCKDLSITQLKELIRINKEIR